MLSTFLTKQLRRGLLNITLFSYNTLNYLCTFPTGSPCGLKSTVQEFNYMLLPLSYYNAVILYLTEKGDY